MVYKGEGIFQYVRASHDSPDEEAWLVVPDAHTRATWHRKDGSLIRPWTSDYALGPMSYEGLIQVPFVGATGTGKPLDINLLVDEGL